MKKYLPEDVFGLLERQVNKSNEEVNNMFIKEVKLIEFNLKENRYDYKLFNTTKQLEENELKEAIQFVNGLKKINNYFKDIAKELTIEIINLSIDLIDLKKNKDIEEIKKKCDLIKEISMKILENTNIIEEIVGLYEFNVLINTFLNK